MPLVRTPMIAPTTVYRALPAASPQDAALLVVRALERRPVWVGKPEGRAAELASMMAPGMARLVAYLAYAVMPETSQQQPNPLAAGVGAIPRLLRRV